MSDTADQFEVFPTSLCLLRTDPPENVNRFYRMTVQLDLFGGACLIREWGRIGSPGHIRMDHFADEGQAITALIELARVKRKRGYRLEYPG